eukprot:TRINITY_DN16818_c0_g1_i2.p1 TRINITY_DN16818_c0_g1~~TRINITY_DN16818_c0_g1_i2.p1  ORF type:complete len:1215 (+),score=182.65 TRINITY_DN16818_c0_g1_i2:87-3647(+)
MADGSSSLGDSVVREPPLPLGWVLNADPDSAAGFHQKATVRLVRLLGPMTQLWRQRRRRRGAGAASTGTGWQKTFVAVLRSTRGFSSWPSSAIQELADHSEHRVMLDGEWLICPGEDGASGITVLLSGHADHWQARLFTVGGKGLHSLDSPSCTPLPCPGVAGSPAILGEPFTDAARAVGTCEVRTVSAATLSNVAEGFSAEDRDAIDQAHAAAVFEAAQRPPTVAVLAQVPALAHIPNHVLAAIAQLMEPKLLPPLQTIGVVVAGKVETLVNDIAGYNNQEGFALGEAVSPVGLGLVDAAASRRAYGFTLQTASFCEVWTANWADASVYLGPHLRVLAENGRADLAERFQALVDMRVDCEANALLVRRVSAVPLLQDVLSRYTEEDDWVQLLRCATFHGFLVGEKIVRHQDECDRLWMPLRGALSAEASLHSAKERLRNGEWHGFTCLFSHRWRRTVVALERTDIISISRSDLLDWLARRSRRARFVDRLIVATHTLLHSSGAGAHLPQSMAKLASPRMYPSVQDDDQPHPAFSLHPTVPWTPPAPRKWDTSTSGMLRSTPKSSIMSTTAADPPSRSDGRLKSDARLRSDASNQSPPPSACLQVSAAAGDTSWKLQAPPALGRNLSIATAVRRAFEQPGELWSPLPASAGSDSAGPPAHPGLMSAPTVPAVHSYVSAAEAAAPSHGSQSSGATPGGGPSGTKVSAASRIRGAMKMSVLSRVITETLGASGLSRERTAEIATSGQHGRVSQRTRASSIVSDGQEELDPRLQYHFDAKHYTPHLAGADLDSVLRNVQREAPAEMSASASGPLRITGPTGRADNWGRKDSGGTDHSGRPQPGMHMLGAMPYEPSLELRELARTFKRTVARHTKRRQRYEQDLAVYQDALQAPVSEVATDLEPPRWAERLLRVVPPPRFAIGLELPFGTLPPGLQRRRKLKAAALLRQRQQRSGFGVTAVSASAAYSPEHGRWVWECDDSESPPGVEGGVLALTDAARPASAAELQRPQEVSVWERVKTPERSLLTRLAAQPRRTLRAAWCRAVPPQSRTTGGSRKWAGPPLRATARGQQPHAGQVPCLTPGLWLRQKADPSGGPWGRSRSASPVPTDELDNIFGAADRFPTVTETSSQHTSSRARSRAGRQRQPAAAAPNRLQEKQRQQWSLIARFRALCPRPPAGPQPRFCRARDGV